MFVTIAPTAVVLYCVCLFNLSSLVPIGYVYPIKDSLGALDPGEGVGVRWRRKH